MKEISLKKYTRQDTSLSSHSDEVRRLADRTEELRSDTLKNNKDETISRHAVESLNPREYTRQDTSLLSHSDEVRYLANRTEKLRLDTLKNEEEDEILSRHAAESLNPREISTNAEGYVTAFTGFIERTIGAHNEKQKEIPIDKPQYKQILSGKNYIDSIKILMGEEQAEAMFNSKAEMDKRTEAAIRSCEYNDIVKSYDEIPLKHTLESYAQRYFLFAQEKPTFDKKDYFDHEKNLPSFQDLKEEYPDYTEEQHTQLFERLRTYKFPSEIPSEVSPEPEIQNNKDVKAIIEGCREAIHGEWNALIESLDPQYREDYKEKATTLKKTIKEHRDKIKAQSRSDIQECLGNLFSFYRHIAKGLRSLEKTPQKFATEWPQYKQGLDQKYKTLQVSIDEFISTKELEKSITATNREDRASQWLSLIQLHKNSNPEKKTLSTEDSNLPTASSLPTFEAMLKEM